MVPLNVMLCGFMNERFLTLSRSLLKFSLISLGRPQQLVTCVLLKQGNQSLQHLGSGHYLRVLGGWNFQISVH